MDKKPEQPDERFLLAAVAARTIRPHSHATHISPVPPVPPVLYQGKEPVEPDKRAHV